MIKVIKYVMGVDVSKDKLDFCLMQFDTELNHKVKATRKFTNSGTGFKELMQWIKKHCKEKVPVQVLMEASGVYHEKLAIYLTEKNLEVFVILPNKARRYMQAEGLKSKNDKIDARGLALMCARQKFTPWKPVAKFYYELKIITRHYQSIQESITILKNQLHSMEHSAYVVKEVLKQQKKMIAMFIEQREKIVQHLDKHIESNEEVKRKIAQICKIKGVSVITVATILAETGGFELFQNIPQLISYAGYDVVENQSGKHFGRTKISKKGNSRIRRILHMPGFNAVRFDKGPFAELYHRVYERTQLKMKAYVEFRKNYW
jgi:transposase